MNNTDGKIVYWFLFFPELSYLCPDNIVAIKKLKSIIVMFRTQKKKIISLPVTR